MACPWPQTCSLPLQVPFSDWELRPEDVSICKRANGEDWQIGNGAFGQVRRAFCQPCAVNAVMQKALGVPVHAGLASPHDEQLQDYRRDHPSTQAITNIPP